MTLHPLPVRDDAHTTLAPVVDALRAALLLTPEDAQVLAREGTRLELIRCGASRPAIGTGELTIVVCGELACRAAHDGTVLATLSPGAVLPATALPGVTWHARRTVLLAHVAVDMLVRSGLNGARVLQAVLGAVPAAEHARPGLVIGLSGIDPALTLEVAHGLVAALGRHGTVSLATNVRAGAGPQGRLALERAVSPADFRLAVLVSVSPSAPPEVDRWLHVVHGSAPAEGPPQHDAAAAEASSATLAFTPGTAGLAPRTLLLMHHPSVRLPRGTPGHLAHHRPDMHRHLRRGDPRDLGRIARELAGVSVGFTFGAGGARGLAHLGVLRAAQESGVPVDLLAGASIGAVIGGLVGLGHGPADRRAIVDRLVQARPFTEWTLPTSSLISGARFERLAEEVFGSADLTDLWIPLATITCDVGNFTESEHRAGPLAATLLAACVLPGVLPPRVLDGRVLVDGGTTNMLPVSLVRSQSPGPIVAVDVSPWDPIAVPPERYPVGVAALRARWRGAALLSALHVFWRAISFRGAQRAKEESLCADVRIFPAVGGRSFVDLDAFEVLERAGYEAARDAFEGPRGRALPRV